MRRLAGLVRDRWWAQGAAVYGVFLVFRSLRGAVESSASSALANALDVVGAERALGLLHEDTMQAWILGSDLHVRAWNVFYGVMHDAVAVLVLVVLWRRARPRFRRYRNVAGWMLLLGLVGFVAYPITPPRLMPAEYGFVDTGVEVGGIGPVQGATEDAGGNRFAAMPSLHVGRAAWALVALLPVVRRRALRWALVAYPLAMTFATVVTANHWLLDGAGGLATLAAALALEWGREALFSRGEGVAPRPPRPRT